MKKNILTLLLIPMLVGCFSDQGNYDYLDLAEITIENVPEMIEVLQNVDNIIITPTIRSSLEGIISENNPYFSVQYRIGYQLMGSMTDANGNRVVFLTLNPDGNFNLDIPANFGASSYVIWMTVTDNRTNVVTSFFIPVTISTTTYEGWLVLCDEGVEERVRLDMISKISSTRIETISDIIEGMPVIHRAIHIGFHPAQMSPGDQIFVFSEEGGYRVNANDFTTDETWNYIQNAFAIPPGGGTEKVVFHTPMSITNDPSYMLAYVMAVTDAGNAYAYHTNAAGAAFGFPVNVPVSGTTPDFRVAPFIGFSPMRPANGVTALFYDIDNQRFMAWRHASREIMTPLADPTENMMFSYQTGKDMIYMENTRRSSGLVYAIMQDNQGDRSLYGINMGGNGFVQELYQDNINAPDFGDAIHFAFHSQYAVMFYATSSKVYLYNIATSTAYDITSSVLNAGEEVTLLKFNLYRLSALGQLNTQTEAFMNQQFQLIVGSFNASAGTNGGRVGFYELNAPTNTVSKLLDYNGFAKVRDVLYRERN